MIFNNVEGFYFDRIHIVSWCSKWTLEKQLPLSKMIAECKSLNIVKFDEPDAKLNKTIKNDSNKKLCLGYKSKLEVIAPTSKFLRLLSENEAALGRAYKISYAEIAHDVFCESAGEAELKADIVFDKLRKKYSFGRIYEKLYITKKELIKNRSRGVFAFRTFYSSYEKEEKEKEEEEKEKGKKRDRFKYVIYARHSKINDRHCTHREWRITGSGMIRKKAHILTVKDLCSFDFVKFFREKESQYLIKEKINHLALGKWLKRYDGRKTLTKRQFMSVEIAARHYTLFRIDTYSDLVRHFKSEKELIKKKPSVRSEWEQRLMSLKSYERFRIIEHEKYV